RAALDGDPVLNRRCGAVIEPGEHVVECRRSSWLQRQDVVAALGRHRMRRQAEVALPARSQGFLAGHRSMSMSGEFPEAVGAGVRLADGKVRERFAFGIDDEDRYAEV